MNKSPIFQYLQNLIRYRLSLFIFCLILVQACSTTQNTASGQFQAKGAKFGLLLMAHGGTEEWNEAVQNATTEISDKYPVEIAFGMADAGSIEESVRRLEGLGVEDVGVVRMFVSGESWYERTQQILGILEGAPSKGAN